VPFTLRYVVSRLNFHVTNLFVNLTFVRMILKGSTLLRKKRVLLSAQNKTLALYICVNHEKCGASF